MTHEEIMELDSEKIEARMAEIEKAIEEDGADFEALSAELDSIKERKAVLAEEQRKADIEAVVDGIGTVDTNIEVKEIREMADIREIRASKAYADAYAKYIKTEDDTECRALLTELVQDGVVPVPYIVEDVIATAWAKNEILSRVKKTYIKGILRVGFELSASAAVVHEEGDKAIDEEELALGIIELKPASIKKFITISDEAIDLTGEAFLRYVYDELTYQIAKKAEDSVIALLDAAPAAATPTAVGVPVVKASPAIGVIASAIANLSDRASNPVIIMNKLSWASFKALQYAGSFDVDPFEGLTVLFNNTITAISDAAEDDAYAFVGDLGVGVQANFPNGEEIKIKYDDLTLAEADLVKIVGREYVALGLVAPDAFVKITMGA